MHPAQKETYSAWLHRFAWLTAGTTLMLILAGGLVTSTGSGLAVPDWPTTFGHNMFLYPWSQMVGGIFYEHSHRLIGSLVGLLTLVLALWLWLRGERRWLCWLGAGALGMVVVQGVLGGLRVILLQQTLALIHACLAQAFFALTVVLVLATSRQWRGPSWPVATPHAGSVRRLALAAAALVYLQIVFGAILRHTGSALEVHILLALVVGLHVVLLARRVFKACPNQEKLTRPVLALCLLLGLQLFLGLGAYWGRFGMLGPARVVITTAHVVTGALMWAAALTVALQAYRFLALSQGESSAASVRPEVGPKRVSA